MQEKSEINQITAGGDKEKFKAKSGGILSKVTCLDEAQFYQRVFSPDNKDLVLLHLKTLIPQFYGIKLAETQLRKHAYKATIQIQNLATGLQPVSVLDLKLGKITWGPQLTPEAQAQRKKKCELTTSASLGYRISGFCISNAEGKIIKQEGRGFDKGLEAGDVEKIIREFFFTDRSISEINTIIESAVEQIEKIEDFFSKVNTTYQFNSMSVLLIKSEIKPEIRIRLIDFAHVYPLGEACGNPPGSERDQNVLHGVISLLLYLKKLKSGETE